MWQKICNKYFGIHLNLPQLHLAKDRMSNAFFADKQLVESDKKTVLQLNYTIQCCSNWAERKEHFSCLASKAIRNLQQYRIILHSQMLSSHTWCAPVHTVPWFSCLCHCVRPLWPPARALGWNVLFLFASLGQAAFSVPAFLLAWLSCCSRRAF